MFLLLHTRVNNPNGHRADRLRPELMTVNNIKLLKPGSDLFLQVGYCLKT
jgi:hypothetical protein